MPKAHEAFLTRIIHKHILARTASEGDNMVYPRLRFALVFRAPRRYPWLVNNPPQRAFPQSPPHPPDPRTIGKLRAMSQLCRSRQL